MFDTAGIVDNSIASSCLVLCIVLFSSLKLALLFTTELQERPPSKPLFVASVLFCKEINKFVIKLTTDRPYFIVYMLIIKCSYLLTFTLFS